MLSLDEAIFLVGHCNGGFLWCQRDTISADVAAVLAKHMGPLKLNSLGDELSQEIAAELAKHTGGLSLNRLPKMSTEVAVEFGKYRGPFLELDGISSLSDHAAAGLGQYLARPNVTLSLDGLTSLSEKAADGLMKHMEKSGSSLSLRGRPLLLAQEVAMAKNLGILNFGSPGRLSKRILAIGVLRKAIGSAFAGLSKISVGMARDLALYRGTLQLGVSSLSVEVARALAKHQGPAIKLVRLSSLSTSAAKALARYNGDLYVFNLIELSDAAIRALKPKQARGELHCSAQLQHRLKSAIGKAGVGGKRLKP